MNSILVVEDDGIIRQDIQITLQRLGYLVAQTAQSGAEALAALELALPDLVLMDIRLKGPLDGIQTTAKIRERWDLPVVYLTSHSDDATIMRAKETAPHGYLLKPFNERDLRTTIEVAIRKHELELKLAQRERWFATTLDSIGDAVIATDPTEAITFMNPVAELLTGWKLSDARGRKITEVFKLVDKKGHALDGTMGQAIRERFRVELPADTRLVTRDGNRKDVDDSSTPIVDDRGRILGGVAVFRDVTERKRLEQRLVQSERLVSIGTMAAGVAHEINNPLAAAVANIQFALERLHELRGNTGAAPRSREESASLDETIEALQDANQAGARVRDIVADLKKFSRTDEAPRAPLDLPDVIDAAVKLTEHHVRHCATLVRRYGTTPLVEANEGRLVQLLTNLILNAAQAIGPGKAAVAELIVSTRTDDAGRAEISVRDTGSGIAKDDLEKIFDPFFTTKPVGQGTGLGLAICHSVVTTLGGEISVQSELGRGTEFKVALPPASGAAEPARPASVAPTASRPAQVLSVDDEPAVGRVIDRVLKGQHVVTSELDARKALARIAHGQKFDVIFCDLVMPGMSGMDFYHAIKSVDPDLAERIVFLTGGAFTSESAAFLHGRTNLVIMKPFSVERLRAVVMDYIT